MWVPDLVETYAQKTAAVRRSEVQIQVTESMLKADEARLAMTIAALASAESGIKKAQANYDRWESESKRIKALAASKVIDEQVRDETYRQFEESVAAREQSYAMVSEAKATRDRAIADRDKAKVDIDAAKADLTVAQAEERLAKVFVDFGKIRAPYDGVITRRNVNPGDYLQPGGGGSSSPAPLYVLEQVDPVRVFVGVPELYSGFIKDQALASLRIQALPGREITGKVVRSSFSLSSSTRTMQAEIDIPNPEGVLRPGMYVTVSIAIDRGRTWTVPSTAIRFRGQQAYLFLAVDGKIRQVPVQVGPSDDRFIEVLRKHNPGTPAETWAEIDGNEQVLIGTLDAQSDGQPVPGTAKP
jgi:multidrug efflux pump subunit AcrA (membrane-fusion protein)